MKLRTLFTINGIVALSYGISFLVLTSTILKLYGITQGPAENLLGQYFGVALVAIGLITWLAREITDTQTQRAMITSLLISDLIGIIVSVSGVLSGVMGTFGWSAVAIYVLFSLGYAYFQFNKPSALEQGQVS